MTRRRQSRRAPGVTGPGGVEAFREMVEADVGVDRIGIAATSEGGLGFSFPVVVVSGVK